MAFDPLRRGLIAFAVVTLVACDNDGGVTLAPRVPLAYTRFVHAVADTGATDWRFIDGIENSPVAFGLAFRGFTPYQATTPGVRRLRVFPSSTDINVTSKVLIDTALSFAPDTYHTIVHFGYADPSRSPKHRIVVFIDTMPTLDAASVGVRAVHLGAALGNLDFFASDTGAAIPLPAAALVSGESVGSASGYKTIPVGALAIRVTVEGQRTPILVSARAPLGVAAVAPQNLTAIGGSTMPKSVLSALLFPRSFAGTSAPQGTAFAIPALVFVVDRHPR